MTTRNVIYGILLITVLTCSAYAQNARTKFTSVYTDLAKGCKIFSGKNGTDDASLCKGVGGYRIRVYGSAAAVHINAERKGSESVSLATLSVEFDDSKTRLEWRLADGKPFAVIMRVPKYGEESAENPYFGKVIGEELIVRGLIGHGNIDSSIDSKTANANAKARELADAAYAASK